MTETQRYIVCGHDYEGKLYFLTRSGKGYRFVKFGDTNAKLATFDNESSAIRVGEVNSGIGLDRFNVYPTQMWAKLAR